MASDDRTFELREPLSERSRLIRRPEVQVGLLDDGLLLFQPEGTVACMLEEHAAALWLECAGQPFGEVLDRAAETGGAGRREVIELFRALRLLDMVCDVDSASPGGSPGLSSSLPRADQFRFRGELIDSDDERRASVGFGGADCTLDLELLATDARRGVVTTIVVPGAVEETERQLLGLEAIMALARELPDTRIDVLARLEAHCRVVVRPEPTHQE